ncbi:blast:Allatostatin-A [Drosophila guanche]|uniref:Blast:Allatostatin-A n=3 Tax=obscura subgroup TaxID=32357 RepID=A0A3B0K0F8_DROGU|nr:blast:Allatostatin-A [Drosophila guanche]
MASVRRVPVLRAHSITMNTLNAHLLLLALCCVGYIACSPVIGQEQRSQVSGEGDVDGLLGADEMADNGADIDKRVERYAFGLGRRAYMYNNGGPGMKRLPVYNFGLGKRSRPYSFGLGKRSDYDYDQDNEIDYRVPPANYMGVERAVRPGRQNKRTTRPQPFNFGLGRR